jgi:branched-chain amino acid transport system substrate-binding protein
MRPLLPSPRTAAPRRARGGRAHGGRTRPATGVTALAAALAAAVAAALAGCAATTVPANEIGIGVGALPGRPGYDNVIRGVELAIAELNRTPGLRFRIVLPDDSARSAVAVAAAHRANPEVFAVVGHPESGQSQLAIPVYADSGVDGTSALAAVSPTASSPSLSGISEWFFRVAPSDKANARAVAGYARDSLGFRTAALIYRNDAYGRDWAEAFADAWRDGDGALLIRDPYLAGETDWDLYATHIANRDPEVVLFPGVADEAAMLLRAMRRAGARARFIGGDGTEALARQPEFRGARYVTFFQADHATSPAGQAFLAAWNATYPDPPDMFAALSYDAALAIGTAARAARPITRRGIRRALAQIAVDGVVGRIAFDPRSHDVVGRSVVVSTVGP